MKVNQTSRLSEDDNAQTGVGLGVAVVIAIVGSIIAFKALPILALNAADLDRNQSMKDVGATGIAPLVVIVLIFAVVIGAILFLKGGGFSRDR